MDSSPSSCPFCRYFVHDQQTQGVGEEPQADGTGNSRKASTAVAFHSRRCLPSHLPRSIRRLRWSVYVDASVPDSFGLTCDAAALFLLPDAAFSHHTAAALYGLPVTHSTDLHVMVPVGISVPKAAGIIGHEGLKPEDVRVDAGRRIVAPERLFVDMAAVLDLTFLVVLGDAMLSTPLTKLDVLRAYIGAVRRRRGICRARTAVGQLDPRSESAMEVRATGSLGACRVTASRGELCGPRLARRLVGPCRPRLSRCKDRNRIRR